MVTLMILGGVTVVLALALAACLVTMLYYREDQNIGPFMAVACFVWLCLLVWSSCVLVTESRGYDQRQQHGR